MYIKERKWSEDQTIVNKRDGSLILEFSCQSKRELIAWVLSFGDQAEIISPKELKAAFVDKLKAINTIYGI